MAKINIPNISSPYASQNALNVRFKMIEDVLNDKVLWRDNPIGEVNTLKNDIDLGNNDLLNVGLVSAASIMVQGRGIEEGLTEVLDRCIEQADEAEASANAAAAEASNAEASAIRAEEAAEQAELPIVSPGDEGKVLTVSPSLEKEWAEVPEGLPPYSVADEGKILKVSSLGEVEWGVDEKELPPYTVLEAGKTLSVNETGNAVEWTVPPKGSVNIAPQTIVKSQVGSRPAGWTAADCDAPVMSIIANRLPIFSSNWCGGVSLKASSVYGPASLPWKAFNGTTVGGEDCWATSSGSFTGGIGDEWIEIDFGIVRTIDSINMASRDSTDWATSFPKDFQLIADGVVAETKTGVVAAGRGVLQSIVLTAPITCRLLRIRITAIGGNPVYVTIGRLEPVFADVAQGHFGITAGLQVAYADNGRVQLSGELAAPQSVDLSAAADGTHHVYADIAEDGTFSGFGHTDIPPETGTSRGGVDALPTFSDYTLAGWGTVSADSEGDPTWAAWKAFNRTVANTDDFWGSGRNDGTGWLRTVFTAPRTVVGYILVPRSGGTNSWMPESWAFKYGGTDTPDTTAQVVSGFVFPGQGLAGKSVFMLDAPVTAASIELEITASSDPNNLVGLAMFVPLFAGDLYNPAELAMYNVAGSPVRRVYIGTAEKASGAITSVHCYSLGTVVTMPINSGNPVATLSLVLDELPYAYSRMMQAEPQLYGEGIWGKAGWVYTSDGLGVSATVRKEAIRVVTGTGLTAQYASIGGDFSANIPSPAKIRVTVHRGY